MVNCCACAGACTCPHSAAPPWTAVPSCVRCVGPPLAFGDGWSDRTDRALQSAAAACFPDAPCTAQHRAFFLVPQFGTASLGGCRLVAVAHHHLSPFLVVCCRFAVPCVDSGSTSSAATRRVEVSLLSERKKIELPYSKPQGARTTSRCGCRRL